MFPRLQIKSTMDAKQINKGAVIGGLHQSYGVVGEDTTILDLNDDCLESIFEYIQHFKSQIQIAKCCQRFSDIVKGLWERQTKHRVADYRMLVSCINYSDRKYYLTAMRTEFHTIKFYMPRFMDYLKEVEHMRIECFPCIERCEFSKPHEYFEISNDGMHALSKLLPNLKYLKMPAEMEEKYLLNFQNLEELNIFCERYLGTYSKKYLLDTLSKRWHVRILDIRLVYRNHDGLVNFFSNLEILKLNSSTLNPRIKEVLKLPQMKQLIVSIDNLYKFKNVCRQIMRQKGAQIKAIAVHLEWQQMTPMCVSELDYLLPETDINLTDTQFNAGKYERCQFARLETLCIRDLNLWKADDLGILRLCPVLKHLDISTNYAVDASLLKDIWNYWHKEKPNQVLCVYYWNANLEREIREGSTFWDTQKHFKLIKSFPAESYCGLDSNEQNSIAFSFE